MSDVEKKLLIIGILGFTAFFERNETIRIIIYCFIVYMIVALYGGTSGG